jgi:hypothetical protein
MNKHTYMPALLAALLILPTVTMAQDELLDEEQVPINYYTVELIVFTYEENVGVGSEVFPPEEAERTSDEIEKITVIDKARRHPDAIGLRPVLLDKENFTLVDVARRLELLDAYDPIMHVGWTQAGFPAADTDPLPLPEFGAVPPGLAGSFTLYLERYLHLVVDLTMDGSPAEVAVEFDDEPAYSLTDIAPPTGPVYYRIQEDRILKNGEIRYFDHPKFGVVAKVTRVDEEQQGPAGVVSSQ